MRWWEYESEDDYAAGRKKYEVRVLILPSSKLYMSANLSSMALLFLWVPMNRPQDASRCSSAMTTSI